MLIKCTTIQSGRKIKKNKKIKAFSDLYFSPISLGHSITLLKITKKLSGIFHLSGKKL